MGGLDWGGDRAGGWILDLCWGISECVTPMDGQEGGGSPLGTCGGAPICPDLAAPGWEDPGPLICLVPADPSPSMTAAPFSRVYGVSLGTHLQELGRDIALPIEACVMMLLSEGMKEEVGLAGVGGEGAPGPSLGPTPTLGTQRPGGVASCC